MTLKQTKQIIPNSANIPAFVNIFNLDYFLLLQPLQYNLILCATSSSGCRCGIMQILPHYLHYHTLRSYSFFVQQANCPPAYSGLLGRRD